MGSVLSTGGLYCVDGRALRRLPIPMMTGLVQLLSQVTHQSSGNNMHLNVNELGAVFGSSLVKKTKLFTRPLMMCDVMVT